jgi:hypothetical protein
LFSGTPYVPEALTFDALTDNKSLPLEGFCYDTAWANHSKSPTSLYTATIAASFRSVSWRESSLLIPSLFHAYWQLLPD